MKKLLFVVFMLLTLAIVFHAQVRSKDLNPESPRLPFRYAIVYNKFDPRLDEQDEDRRIVTVLMDKKAFSKTNLISLFRHLLKRFSRPRLLTVELFTDPSDLSPPGGDGNSG